MIKTIHCDGECQAMMSKVKDDLKVDMNFVNVQDHMPEAEWNNCMIKEWIQVAHHQLPCKAIPRVCTSIEFLSHGGWGL